METAKIQGKNLKHTLFLDQRTKDRAGNILVRNDTIVLREK